MIRHCHHDQSENGRRFIPYKSGVRVIGSFHLTTEPQGSMTKFLASLLVCLLLSSPLEGHPNRQKRNVQVAVNALNAFPSDAKVTFILPDGNRIQNLEYGQFTTAQVYLGAQSKAEAVLLPSNGL